MKNWFDIIPPRQDIRQGHCDKAVLAANLGGVARAPPRPTMVIS